VHKTLAKQLAKALEPHQPLFIEEPLLPGQVPEMEKLYQKTSIPIAVCSISFHKLPVAITNLSHGHSSEKGFSLVKTADRILKPDVLISSSQTSRTLAESLKHAG
jgi:hypothetical protein